MTRGSSEFSAISHAIALHQAGDLSQAERLYQTVLNANPKHFDAINLLGMIFLQRGQYELAEKQFRRATKINATIADAFNNHGVALLELGRADEALECYDRAVALKPNDAASLNNRGAALLNLGRVAAALDSFDSALIHNPNFARALFNRGNALKVLKRFDDAIASYDQAISQRPDYAEAFNNRGNVLLTLERAGAAAADFQQAIKINPLFVDAYCNLAAALIDLKRFSEALAAIGKALQLDAKSAAVWTVRGDTLRNLYRYDEALAAYDKALALDPQRVDSWVGRARALDDLRRHAESAADYKKLLELDPDYEYAKGAFLYEKMLACDWRGIEPLVEEIRADIAADKKAIEPFCFQAVTNSLAEARRCAEIYSADKCRNRITMIWTGDRCQNRKIRIGYLSGELRSHAVARLMVELFELHDKNRFELFAFDNGAEDDGETRRRINRAFDKVVNVSNLDDPSAAAAIQANNIEILINLNGYYGRGRTNVFARRPAPIQVNYLGFSGTMGGDFMDYIIADKWIVPIGCETFYSEKVIYLPYCFQPSDSKRCPTKGTLSRSDLGLPDDSFIFCCFNNSFKITPQLFDVWMRVLGQIGRSVLWLPFDSESVVTNLRNEAAFRGIAPERLIFSPRAEQLADYFARYQLADLFLDCFPFNAGATANDALWAGLPLLTCSGEVYAARMAGSVLRALGLPELIATSLGDYEALALKLARDRVLLNGLKEKLRTNSKTFPLFDTAGLTRHIEAAYVMMLRRYEAGLQPISVTVDAQI